MTTKIQRKKLSHGGLKAPEKQSKAPTAVGSGDWLGITVLATRDMRNIIGNAVMDELRKKGLHIISRKEYFMLIGDENAAAASAEYHEPNRGRRTYHPIPERRYLD